MSFKQILFMVKSVSDQGHLIKELVNVSTGSTNYSNAGGGIGNYNQDIMEKIQSNKIRKTTPAPQEEEVVQELFSNILDNLEE